MTIPPLPYATPAGAYDPAAGLFRSGAGRPCFYVASDNLCDPAYAQLTPELLTSEAGRAGLLFDHVTERGVVFHMLGALAEFGKLGAVCIAPTRAAARELFDDTVALLERCASGLAEKELSLKVT